MSDARGNLAEALLSRGKEDHPAVVEPDRSWTYGELGDKAARVAGALQGLGVAPGDRVVVILPDGLESVASVLGAMWAGAIAVPVSELGTALDVRGLVRDSGAVVAIVGASTEPALDEVRSELPSLRAVITVGQTRGDEKSFESVLAGADPVPAAPVRAAEPSLLLYTAHGRGAGPKGVLHSHDTIVAAHRATAEAILGLGAADRVLALPGLASAYGFGAGLVFPLLAGGTSILLPGQPRTPAVEEIIEKQRPTVVFATPSLYGQLLVDVNARGAAPKLSSARVCVSGTETMPPSLYERLKTKLGIEVMSGYSLSEAFHFVLANRPGRSRPGSAGAVIDGYEVRLLTEAGAPAAPNEIGTLLVRGPSVGLGYWNRPEDTAEAFKNGWLWTGDRFFMDSDGFYFHCGREDDLFKVSGKWVAPVEVEQALLSHGAVWECAVVGVDDENGLTKPLAFVVPNVGHTPGPALESELIEFVKKEIAPYKYPRWIEFVNELPKGQNGQVLRYKLVGMPKKKRRRPATYPPVS